MTKDKKTDSKKSSHQIKFENVKARNIPDDISDIFLDNLLSEIKDDSNNLAQQSHDKVKSSIMDMIKEKNQTRITPLHIVESHDVVESYNEKPANTSEVIPFNEAKSSKPNYRFQSILAMTSLAASLMIGVFFGVSGNIDPYINTTLEIAGLSMEEESSLIDIIDNSNS